MHLPCFSPVNPEYFVRQNFRRPGGQNILYASYVHTQGHPCPMHFSQLHRVDEKKP